MIEQLWLKSYPKDVPAMIDADKYPNALSMFDRSFETYPDKPAFVNMGQSLTYKELNEKSDAFAAYMQNELGMKKG